MNETNLYDANGFKYAQLLCGVVVWFSSPEKFKEEQVKFWELALADIPELMPNNCWLG